MVERKEERIPYFTSLARWWLRRLRQPLQVLADRLRQLRLGRLAQLHQQLVIAVEHVVAPLQVALDAREQRGRHFRIGHRTVRAPRIGQVMKRGERAQAEAARLRVQPPREQQRAGKRLLDFYSLPRRGRAGV